MGEVVYAVGVAIATLALGAFVFTKTDDRLVAQL